MTVSLTDLKNFLRVDASDTSDDSLIKSLASAAEEYLLNAGASKDQSPELYSLAVRSLTLHWYDNRDNVANEAEIPINIERIVKQLQCIGG